LSSGTEIRDSLIRGLGKIEGGLAFDLVELALQKNPSLIEELVPGMKLVPRKMSSKERAVLMSIGGAKARASKAKERYEVALPYIKAALEANPAISLRGLADILDAAGVKPMRADKWSAPSVVWILQKCGLRGYERSDEQAQA
jgi:hypothetical protein